jgi:hypothetical protein
MKGFIYRRGTAIKDAGERLHWYGMIRLGFWLRGLV